MRTVVVGQAPALASSSARAFDGPSGDRLAAHAGLGSREELREAFDLRNLLRRFPGSAGRKGDRFPMDRARAAAARLLPRLGGRRVILAGVGVARAFGIRAAPLRWLDLGGARAVVLPHPSGVNLWWNDEGNRRRARRLLRAERGRRP